MNKFLPLLLGLLLTSAAQAAQTLTFGPGPETAGRALDAIVAVVDDDVITRRELDAATARAELQLRTRKAPTPPRAVLEAQVLEGLILNRLQARAAERQGITVDDTTLNAAIDSLAQQNQISLSQLRQTVEKDGVSFAQFRDDVRRELLSARLRQKLVDSQVKVSEQDVASLTAPTDRSPSLTEGPGQADPPTAAAQPDSASEAKAEPTDSSAVIRSGARQYRMAQLLIALPESATARQTEATQRQAETVLAQLEQGADFARTAAQVSASETRDGGDLGWRTAEQLPTVFSDLAPTMKPGELRLVQSPGGFHIVKLLAVRGGGAPPARVAQSSAAKPVAVNTASPTAAAPSLSPEQNLQRLLRRRADEEWNLVLRRLRDEAYVEIRLPGASLPTGSVPEPAAGSR